MASLHARGPLTFRRNLTVNDKIDHQECSFQQRRAHVPKSVGNSFYHLLDRVTPSSIAMVMRLGISRLIGKASTRSNDIQLIDVNSNLLSLHTKRNICIDF